MKERDKLFIRYLLKLFKLFRSKGYNTNPIESIINNYKDYKSKVGICICLDPGGWFAWSKPEIQGFNVSFNDWNNVCARYDIHVEEIKKWDCTYKLNNYEENR